MTREKLAAEIEHTLVEHRADGVLAERTAAAVIRLVVEACCSAMDQQKGRVFPILAVPFLRSTFLEAPDGKAD